jgi:hypothetical protein
VAQAGDDRYSLEHQAERVGADTHPLVAEAEPRTERAGVHALRATPAAAICRTG